MAAAKDLAYPIATLREHVTALEAAITLTFADPQPKPVHRLRTTSRRIEALLILLDLLPGLPDHAKLARKSTRLLKKLRRAAGAVRDLDVQQDLVPNLLPSRPTEPDDLTGSTSADLHHHTDHARRHHDRLHRHAKRLSDTLGHRRRQEAAALLTTLSKLQSRLAPTLEQLLTTLAPAVGLALSSTQLTTLTRDWYRHHLPASTRTLTTSKPRLLHAVRKVAKLARYIAEVAPAAAPPLATRGTTPSHPATTAPPHNTGTSPAKVAAGFEAVQHAGGAWHDLLALSGIARSHLGKRSPLPATSKPPATEPSSNIGKTSAHTAKRSPPEPQPKRLLTPPVLTSTATPN